MFVAFQVTQASLINERYVVCGKGLRNILPATYYCTIITPENCKLNKKAYKTVALYRGRNQIRAFL